MSKIKGTLSNGFEYKINSDALDDIEFLEMLVDADDDDIASVMMLINKLLGKKQKQRLYDHLRNDKGIVKASDVSGAISEMFDQVKALKN